MDEDSDLNDLKKIKNVLGGAASSRENESEYFIRCESAEGYSPSEVSSYQQHLTPNVDNSFSIFEELTSDPIEEDGIVIDAELEPSFENAICLNKAYHAMLVDLAQQLEVLRNVNLHKQKILRAEIEILKAKPNKKSDKQKKKPISFTFFGMPYFKDAAYNTPPPNGDTQLAQTLGFRKISLLLLNKPISKIEARRLRKGLKEQAIVIESTRLVGMRDQLQKELNDPSISEEEKKDIKSEINSVQRKIYNVRLLPEEKLFDVPQTAFDWHKISIQNFGRSRTPDQLRLYWMHHLRPGVNTSSWTHNENKMLKELVSKYVKGVDWIEVATNMNNGRTPFDCFRRYQEKFNVESRKFGWSNEDNNLLLSLISSYKTQNISDIYWEEIRQNFPGRSKSQIYAHFRYHLYSLDPSPFSAHEDTAILEGIKIGYSLADISLLLGKRSLIQIRNRYKSLLKKPQVKEKDWTEEEDKKLLDMPDVGQLRAHVIRKNFLGRSFSQLFSRYHYLRMKFTTPKEYIVGLKDERLYTEKRYLPKENRKLASRIFDMMSREGYNQDVSGSLLNKLPMLKNNLLNDSEERNRKKRNKYCIKPKNRNIRGKRGVQRKENELKEILRPYMATHTKRPRKLCFPGDGREHGIVFACLYRLLQCDFTLAPNPNDLNEDVCEGLGIAYENYLAFIELMNIIKDIPVPDIASRTGQLNWLPPSLGTLVGYRGLDLHRDYLQTSASRPFVAPENTATITELGGDNEANPLEGPSGQSETVPHIVDEPIASGSNEQEAEVSDDDEISYPRRKPNVITFGDEIADSLLLTRLMTLYFWPGIMSCMYVPDLTKEDRTPEAAEVDPKSPLSKTKEKPPSKKTTKEKRREHLRRVAFKRYGKCKTLNDSVVSTTSVEELNNTVVSTSADGENSEAAAVPSTSAGALVADEVATPPAKRAKRTPAQAKDITKSDRVTRRCRKLCE